MEERGDESRTDAAGDEEVAEYADVNTDATGERYGVLGVIDAETGAESDVYGDTDVVTARLRSITAERQEKSSGGREG